VPLRTGAIMLGMRGRRNQKDKGVLGFHGFKFGTCNGKLTVDFPNLDTSHFINYTSDICSMSSVASEPVFHIS
jgi:hypothetical protein